MPPAQPRTRGAAAAPVPTSAVVMRGSAPPGTFAIPDAGLQIPTSKSFLARFRAGARIRPDPPAPPAPLAPPAPPAQLVEPAPLPPDLPRSPVVANGEPTGGEPDPASPAAPPQPKPELEPETDPKAEPLPEQESKPAPPRDQSTPEHAESNALEVAADEAEDTLINVVADHDALLSERRPSYPILRFCAATALLDQHALDTLGLPLAFVWAPFGDLRDVPRVDRPAKRCGTCGSFVAKGNGGEDVVAGSRFWTCGFCGRNDNDAGEAGLQANISPQTFPELVMDTIEYSHPESAARSSAGRGAVVLIVDENVEPEEAQWARAATAAVHASAAEKGLRFALITVGSGCSVAAQYKKESESAPVLEMMSVARASKLSPEEKEQFFLSPPSAESTGTSSVQDDSPNLYTSYTDVFISPRAPSAMEEDDALHAHVEDSAEDAVPRKRTRDPPDEESRRLDIAIFTAFELISGMADSENSRILCLITGPPTLAEHALRHSYVGAEGHLKKPVPEDDPEMNAALGKLYEQIGSKAGDMRIALDFLCFGAPDGFAGPILLGAAKRSRGGLVYSAAHSFSAASALAEAATFLSQRSTSPGVVSIRVSSPLAVARVIGPAFPTAAPHTYAVPGIDPTTGFTVILKAQPSIENEANVPTHAIVQLAAKSLEATRVVTARVPLTGASEEYLNTLDAEICALVLGKACVVSGGALTQPLIAARSVDVSARRLLRGSAASAGVVRLLYELRRGLLIERQVNADCALVLRSFFLRAECSIASLLMSPRLFTNAMSDESTGLMAEVPLEKSYVTRDAILVLDTGFNVFVYVGQNASPEAEEAISESARSVAAQRMSPCQLWKLRPGPDAEYLLDSYLSPTERPKGGAPPSLTEQGFIHYCKSLAPDSITVRLLQSA